MKKTIKNKNGLLTTAKNKVQFYSNVSWSLVLLGAQALASYKLYAGVTGKSHYDIADYAVIVAATTLAVNTLARVSQLICKEVNNDRSDTSTED